MLTTTPDDGYNLFHQAIMKRDASAWDAILTRYRPLMCAWARRCPSNDAHRIFCEDIADEAFTRTWLALTPERFQSFPNLAALIGYLRACVNSAVIDEARRQQNYSHLHDQLANTTTAPLGGRSARGLNGQSYGIWSTDS